MPASSRAKAEAKGRLAETVALTWLRLKGYRLLARRFKSGLGEIDLIMRRRDVTAFIEVKARANTDAGVEAVTRHQIRRINAGANAWMARDPRAAATVCRFDIVVVSPYLSLRHIENAFPGET
jgi:putative endonuclease